MADLESGRRRLQEILSCIDGGGLVFLGGAGVSTESGIPDFRSTKGVFSKSGKVEPAVLLSRKYFEKYPEEFFDFYFDNMIFADARPNQAHLKLAELGNLGLLSTVITQNIDGLHQAAGSADVLELHGSVYRNYCISCGREYTLDDMVELHGQAADGVPRCPVCGGIVRPDVVLYGEPLDRDVLEKAAESVQSAEMLLIAGTSLQVNPAASLVRCFSGDYLVIIDKAPDPGYEWADLYIEAPVGEVLDF